MDRGCDEIIISKAFAGKLDQMRSETNLKAEVWDGTLVPMDLCSENLDLRIGQEKFKYDGTSSIGLPTK